MATWFARGNRASEKSGHTRRLKPPELSGEGHHELSGERHHELPGERPQEMSAPSPASELPGGNRQSVRDARAGR